ncbi:hypothetical protein P3444_23605 [Vibrio parahaemolyticus]|nr:hypothetical protein [Vibrio parahaemolyticus]
MRWITSLVRDCHGEEGVEPEGNAFQSLDCLHPDPHLHYGHDLWVVTERMTLQSFPLEDGWLQP